MPTACVRVVPIAEATFTGFAVAQPTLAEPTLVHASFGSPATVETSVEASVGCAGLLPHFVAPVEPAD
jgi:hypothetical protein